MSAKKKSAQGPKTLYARLDPALRALRTELCICLALVIAVTAVYWRTTGYDFINLDDNLYVYDNPMVRGGITGTGVAWAFTTYGDNYWSPVTYLSHMLDIDMYGLDAGRHHRTNIIIHALNAVLLFWFLRAATGSKWRSAAAAALFALHPLRVESVAWVAERKDLLGGFFWLATMLAWLRDRRCSFAVVTLFALALMAKPTVVTLPFALLLVDYWPLGRFPAAEPFFARLKHLMREKVPLFAMSAAVSVITYLGQSSVGALAEFSAVPPATRALNAVLAVGLYLRDSFWPLALSVLYPYDKNLRVETVALVAALLGAITLLALLARTRHPFAVCGWLWFLGTLVPVLGLVQAGSQSRADRFTYLPAIGLTVLLVWTVHAALGASRAGRFAGAALALLASATLGVLAARQTGYWSDSIKLYERSLAVTRDNSILHNNLGKALADIGMAVKAADHYREAVRIDPRYLQATNNLGSALAGQGKKEEALATFEQALKIEPRYASAHFNRAVLLGQSGRIADSVKAHREALRLGLDARFGALAHYHLGVILNNEGKSEEAVEEFSGALLLDPGLIDARKNIAIALYNTGKTKEAIDALQRVVKIAPADADAKEKLKFMEANPEPRSGKP